MNARRRITDQNGRKSDTVRKWATIVGVSIALATFSYGVMSGAFRDKAIIEQARAEIPKMNEQIGNLQTEMQLRQMENQVICSDIIEIKAKLDRIENKIDRMLLK